MDETKKEFLIRILLDFHKSRLEGKGYDFFFVLSNELEELNKKL